MKRILTRFSLLAFCIAYFHVLQSTAQAPSDSCINAMEITDLENNCELFDVDDITFDLVNPSCADSSAKNFWVKFTAQGVALNVTVNTFRGPSAEIGLYRFDGAPCDTQSMVELQCDTDTLVAAQPLDLDQEYYLSITYETLPQSNVFLCINNDLINRDPPNDPICYAEPIKYDSSCTNGTLFNATYDQPAPFCVIPPERSVWYHGTTGFGTTGVKIKMDDISIDTNYTIHIFELESDNCNLQPVNVYGFCGKGDSTFTYNNLKPQTDYYYMVASHRNNNSRARFRICFEPLIPPPGCSVNNTCESAQEVNITTDSSATCVPGCNILASRGPSDTSEICYNFPSETVWYKFFVDSSANNLEITLTSSDLDYPHLALYSGDCNNLINETCAREDTFQLTLEAFDIEGGKYYYLAVNDWLGDQGEFDICIQATRFYTSCNYAAGLEVTETSFGSPPEGPFQAGEFVTFKYTIPDWDPSYCNFLQGIVLTAGPGWDRNSFLQNGKPRMVHKEPQANSPGKWEWISTETVLYNLDNPLRNIQKDDILPNGWFFIRDEANTTDPDSSRGDGTICADTSQLSWEIEFTLKVKEYPACEQFVDTTAMSVLIQTFSDGEIGSNPVPSCLEDKFTSIDYSNLCCNGVDLEGTTDTICGGDRFEYDLATDSAEFYFWEVIKDDDIQGASNGNGRLFIQTLSNLTNTVKEAKYTIYAQDSMGCIGNGAEISLWVYPNLGADAGEDISLCIGDTVLLGGSPTATGGKSPYTYRWSDNLPTVANPAANPAESNKYNLTIIDSKGCRASDDTDVIVYEKPRIFLPSDTIYQCPQDSVIIPLQFQGNPPFTYDVFNNAQFLFRDTLESNYIEYVRKITGRMNLRILNFKDQNCNGFVNNQTIPLVLADTTTGILNLQLCNNETITVGDSMITDEGQYIIKLENSNYAGCDSTVYIDLSYAEPIEVINAEIEDETSSSKGSINLDITGGTPPYSIAWSNGDSGPSIEDLDAGTYIALITDNKFCETLDTFIVEKRTSSDEFQSLYKFIVRPQPVKSNTELIFDIPDNLVGKLTLDIYDFKGSNILHKNLDPNAVQKYTWIAEQPGMYYYTFRFKDKIIGKGKLVVY